jgi:predicted secreted protein with PEFG-CTERM motif
MFVISAILIASIGMTSAFAQTDNTILTVVTDKSIYLDGETIVITGEVVTRYPGMPVTVIIQSPSGNIVGIDQLTVNADKKYSTEIVTGGSLMSTGGIYTILVHYGLVEHNTTFELITSDPVTSGTHTVADSSKSVGYEISGGDITSITPEVESNSLIISLDADEDGSVTLIIPRTIFDSVENGQDTEVFVFVDNTEVNFDESTTSTDRTITILFPAGAETIEIVGTFVIPEFGVIAAMILGMAIISVIAVSAKSRLSIIPRY